MFGNIKIDSIDNVKGKKADVRVTNAEVKKEKTPKAFVLDKKILEEKAMVITKAITLEVILLNSVVVLFDRQYAGVEDIDMSNDDVKHAFDFAKFYLNGGKSGRLLEKYGANKSDTSKITGDLLNDSKLLLETLSSFAVNVTNKTLEIGILLEILPKEIAGILYHTLLFAGINLKAHDEIIELNKEYSLKYKGYLKDKWVKRYNELLNKLTPKDDMFEDSMSDKVLTFSAEEMLHAVDVEIPIYESIGNIKDNVDKNQKETKKEVEKEVKKKHKKKKKEGVIAGTISTVKENKMEILFGALAIAVVGYGVYRTYQHFNDNDDVIVIDELGGSSNMYDM